MTSGWMTLGLLADASQTAWERAAFLFHVLAASAGILCLAAGAIAGGKYLRKYANLRRKDPAEIASGGPSLEALNRFVRRMVYAGFALLTAAIAMGLHQAFQPEHKGWFHIWQTHPKMVLAAGTWAVYAIALCVIRGRKFRGRLAAGLSIAGLVLVILVLLLALLMPGQ